MNDKALNNIFDSLATNTFRCTKSLSSPHDYLTFGTESTSMVTESLRQKKVASFSELSKSASLPDEYRPVKLQIRKLVGKSSEPHPVIIGTHPDFVHLEHGGYENHYIVSVFVDIKGSTELAIKIADLHEVKSFKDGLITSVIDIFTAFDGHIHRLHGDAVFAFFGRKDMKKSLAIIDALNAATFLQQFCEKRLNKLFREKKYPELKIRIGIDFGDDDDVLWAKYGIDNCSEITTTSLHTDLAAKLQSRATDNGIMIGDNVKQFIDLPEEFYVNQENYVFETVGMKYRMWQFSWDRYLSRFLFNPERVETQTYKAGKNFQLQCFYKITKDSTWKEYYPNSYPLSKKYDLEFRLSNIGFPHDKIRWYVNNRGKEASQSDLNFETDNCRDLTICLRKTAYTGHHYMKCEIGNQGRTVAKEYFGIYINDN